MISKNKKIKNNTLLLLLFILILVILLFISWQFFFKTNTDNNSFPTNISEETINYAETSEEEQRVIDESKTKTEAPKSNEQAQTVPPDTVKISSVEKIDNEVVVKTQLNGNSWRNCELKITRNSLVQSYKSDVLYQQDFSTCLGFSISINSFAENGIWQFTLIATNSNETKISSEVANLLIE